MEGENFVRLKGKITKPEFRTVGDNNSSLFKAVLALPAVDGKGYQYIKVSSFKHADALSQLSSGTFIEVHGHIEESSFNGKCQYCGGYLKKYWTEVIIDNFIKL